MSQKRRIVL